MISACNHMTFSGLGKDLPINSVPVHAAVAKAPNQWDLPILGLPIISTLARSKINLSPQNSVGVSMSKALKSFHCNNPKGPCSGFSSAMFSIGSSCFNISFCSSSRCTSHLLVSHRSIPISTSSGCLFIWPFTIDIVVVVTSVGDIGGMLL